MNLKLDGRLVSVEFSMGNSSDPVDCYFESGYFVDTEQDLDETQLDRLANDYPDAIHQCWLEYQQDRADRYFDTDD